MYAPNYGSIAGKSYLDLIDLHDDRFTCNTATGNKVKIHDSCSGFLHLKVPIGFKILRPLPVHNRCEFKVLQKFHTKFVRMLIR